MLPFFKIERVHLFLWWFSAIAIDCGRAVRVTLALRTRENSPAVRGKF